MEVIHTYDDVACFVELCIEVKEALLDFAVVLNVRLCECLYTYNVIEYERIELAVKLIEYVSCLSVNSLFALSLVRMCDWLGKDVLSILHTYHILRNLHVSDSTAH